MASHPDESQPAPITVSELNRSARSLLERGLGRVWVEGELSNLARPASGHLYFSLKDENAQIRCAWFRQRQRGPAHRLDNGDQMLVYGKVSLYEARGDYQMIVEQLEPAGEGELRRRFEQLKKKLDHEGLFDAAAKLDLPALPRQIGIVTSPSGAALRDILTVLARRFPAIPVVIYPAAVQGDAAVPEISAALERAVRRAECDVLIVGRGGGSLEDLWAFNEEAVARAIHASPIPVVSAVGHETDVTIADLVADRRAATPSAAAELVAPEQTEWRRRLGVALSRMAANVRRALDDRAQTLDWQSRRLSAASPAGTVRRQDDQLRALSRSIARAMRYDLVVRGNDIAGLHARLRAAAPDAAVERRLHRLEAVSQRLRTAGLNHVERLQQTLRLAARSLDAVSPLATLDRGYAIVTDAESGKLITAASQAPAGRRIEARLAEGRLRATVDSSDE